MTRRARARGLRKTLAGVVAVLALGVYPSAARADLVVLQDSNGFPGASGAETARQKVYVSTDNLRVLDESHGWALFVRLGEKVVQEAYAGPGQKTGQYVERPLSSYQKIRADRQATRASKINEYRRAVAQAKNDTERNELKKALGRMGLRDDGKPDEARLESFPEETRTVSLVVNGERRQVKVEHHVVRENEGPPVFDVWVAPELGRPESVFRFYQEIGTFSDVVVQKVLAIPGFPVEITATLDDGNNKKTLHSKVFEVRDEVVQPVEYQVPAGWELAKGKDLALTDAPEKCASCGREFIVGQGEGRQWRNPFTGKLSPVCSDACRKKVIQEAARK